MLILLKQNKTQTDNLFTVWVETLWLFTIASHPPGHVILSKCLEWDSSQLVTNGYRMAGTLAVAAPLPEQWSTWNQVVHSEIIELEARDFSHFQNMPYWLDNLKEKSDNAGRTSMSAGNWYGFTRLTKTQLTATYLWDHLRRSSGWVRITSFVYCFRNSCSVSGINTSSFDWDISV